MACSASIVLTSGAAVNRDGRPLPACVSEDTRRLVSGKFEQSPGPRELCSVSAAGGDAVLRFGARDLPAAIFDRVNSARHAGPADDPWVHWGV